MCCLNENIDIHCACLYNSAAVKVNNHAKWDRALIFGAEVGYFICINRGGGVPPNHITGTCNHGNALA